MNNWNSIPLSVLDLAPITEGSNASESFKRSLQLAQTVEKLGFNRYWLAEHHNMRGISSSATSVVIGYIAGGTSKIRVGSGGIMLPNHAPLVIAEQFGTLESMYPGRIDLGLGRAPGSDQLTARALRRDVRSAGDDFPDQVQELQSFFKVDEQAKVRAVPGEGLNIPIWLLGSSGFSAQLAGMLGLPFSFASHFAPGFLMQALQIYYAHFQPSDSLQKPYTMLGVNVIVADTEEEAEQLATSQQLAFLRMIRGQGGQLPPPVDSMETIWSPYEKAMVMEQLKYTFVGTKETVRQQLNAFISETKTDELIINTHVFDHKARVRSYELLMQ
ncbi:LLM class flavin-dependent oxidoreductase [Bacillus sp. FJAT-45066]|uniref:LLM class flavin-dependent oxidoreductase n=1 Tax=Bacillus sp. FJAT-45066 TaxID=2011010 RepID=UPI000BB69747|nr:LLM class flavin-dependent oxidoreductase [Bacillus sp. FJAT-45066]